MTESTSMVPHEDIPPEDEGSARLKVKMSLVIDALVQHRDREAGSQIMERLDNAIYAASLRASGGKAQREAYEAGARMFLADPEKT